MLKTGEIAEILSNKGLVKLASNIGPKEPGSNSLGEGHVDYQFKNMLLTVAPGEITLTRVANDAADTSFDCVNAITNTNRSCLGTVRIPGYVYTDNFSGCVFYLYRGDSNHVIGVHAHQGLDTVSNTIQSGALKGVTINKEVRKEYGPADFMLRGGKTLLCRHETRGELTEAEKTGGRNFLAFLSCVEVDKATTFLYSYAGGAEGNRVGRLIHTYEDKF